MLFILQKLKEDHSMFIDQMILKDLLRNSEHEYEELHLVDLRDPEGGLLWAECFPERYKNAIPLGTIEFVNTFIKIFYGIEKMNPIEVPVNMRRPELLKRQYGMYLVDDLPDDGEWFIKDASELKSLRYYGDKNLINAFNSDEGHVYQCSEIIDIKSEYRVYFINGELYTLANYNGDPKLMPDMNVILMANGLYSMQKDYPKSYTMDIAITEKGTCILECHVLFSCGLYTTVLGTDFLHGYIDGMNYLKKYNSEIKPDKKID